MSEEKKVVLITGAAMGQGRAHAVKYAQNGFNVVVADMLDVEDARFQETIRELEALGAEVLAEKCNVCSTPDMEKLFADTWAKFGRLDVVIAIVICTVVTLLCMTLLHAVTARLKVEQMFKFFWTVVSGLALVSLLLVWFVN